MESIRVLLCLLLPLLVKRSTTTVAAGSYRPIRGTLSEYQEKFQITAAATPATACDASTSTKKMGRVYCVIGYGADPTGMNDSSDAILDALNDAFIVQSGLVLLPGVNDLGGVVIDLQGGNYNISKPIRFPPAGGGNLVVQGGTLRASNTFPEDRHLVELWSPNSQKLKETKVIHPDAFDHLKAKNDEMIYYEDITFRDILFDSSYRGGGIFVIDSARIRIDNCFFIHFTTEGILIQKGHETFISSSFLGQHPTVGGDPSEKDFSGTAIDLASNDNAVTDVTIFSASVGVLLRGQANILTGVHCYNKATGFGGIGILVKLPGNSATRLDNCYLDYTGIVLEDPVQVHVTNGFFLGDANIVLKSVNGRISGLNIVDNMFGGTDYGGQPPIVKLDGNFSDIDQVVVDRNNVVKMTLKSTIGRLTVAGNGTKWVTDFSSVLLFPNRINHLQYSFYIQGQREFPAHAVTGVSNNVVVVESDKPVNGVVSMVVDQYNMVGEKSLLM